MPSPVESKTISRQAAIERLREALVHLTDDENCMCRVAADRQLFCKGFDQYSDQQLRERYGWIVRRRPNVTRAELESIANSWQLAQQTVQNVPLSCDVQTMKHDTCHGWDDFSNDQLAAFYKQLIGTEVDVC